MKPARPRGPGHTRPVFRDPQVNLFVKDVETTARFYRDLFGFTETFRTPKKGTPTHVELVLGGLTLGPSSIEAARQMHGLDVGTGPARGEVIIWTDDVDKAFDWLVAKGAVSLRAPYDFRGRLRVASVIDPEGNPVEIVAVRSNHQQKK